MILWYQSTRISLIFQYHWYHDLSPWYLISWTSCYRDDMISSRIISLTLAVLGLFLLPCSGSALWVFAARMRFRYHWQAQSHGPHRRSRSWSRILQHSTAAGFSTSRTHTCQPFVLREKALHWVTCFCSCRKNTLIQLKISLRETNQTKAIDSTSNPCSINPIAYPLPLAAMFHIENSLHRSDRKQLKKESRSGKQISSELNLMEKQPIECVTAPKKSLSLL